MSRERTYRYAGASQPLKVRALPILPSPRGTHPGRAKRAVRTSSGTLALGQEERRSDTSSELQDDCPDLVDLALARVADGTLSDPETPALLRRIARAPLAAEAGHATAPEAPAPPRDSSAEDFVLVAWEIRPGERRYRLARIPANVPWRIRIGAFQRLVHRSFVVASRRLRRFLAPESNAGLPARPGRTAGDLVLLDPASR